MYRRWLFNIEVESVLFGIGGEERVGKKIFCDIGATNRMNGGLSNWGETLAAKGSLPSCLEPTRKASRRLSENMLKLLSTWWGNTCSTNSIWRDKYTRLVIGLKHL